MRLLVVAMQVPDSRAAIRVLEDGSGIDPAGVKYVCSPFDEFAIEQAVQIRERDWDVEEIVVLTAGDASAAGVLRTALAMGADRGVHLAGDMLPLHDEVAMAGLIAAAVKHAGLDPDLVLCGKKVIDNDSGELGPALAERLDLPHVGGICSLELNDAASRARMRRRVDGGDLVMEADLPLLLTCDKGLVDPRYPALPMIMKAKKKPIDVIDAVDVANNVKSCTVFERLQAPAPRGACRMLEGEPAEMARELVRLLHEEAKVI
jgi:electron transfer flavoprotein beta subunit